MQDFRILPGKLTDLNEIVNVHNSVFEHKKTLEFYKNHIASEEDVITVVAKKERIIGYAIGYKEQDFVFYIWMTGVLKEERGKGVGTALMKRIEQEAKNKGYEKIFFKTNNSWREMMRLALKLGYSFSGFKANDWENKAAVWLEKEI